MMRTMKENWKLGVIGMAALVSLVADFVICRTNDLSTGLTCAVITCFVGLAIQLVFISLSVKQTQHTLSFRVKRTICHYDHADKMQLTKLEQMYTDYWERVQVAYATCVFAITLLLLGYVVCLMWGVTTIAFGTAIAALIVQVMAVTYVADRIYNFYVLFSEKYREVHLAN